MTVLRAGAATDIGLVRANNQDQLLLAGSLYAVADGMGGHAAGEVASDTAVKALEAAWATRSAHDARALEAAARDANRKVWQTAQADPSLRGMGTTLVAVALTGSDEAEELAVINVGDSRVYLLRGGELAQLTVDHSLVAELVAEGQLAADEAEFHPQRHVLTRALGVDSDVPVDLVTVAPIQGDRLLLCSDGLIREVSDNQVASVLRRLSDPTEAARELVAEAKLRGGNDNITVVVVDVLDNSERAAQAWGGLAPDRDATASLVAEAGVDDVSDPTTSVPVVAPIPAPKATRRQHRKSSKAVAPTRPRVRIVTARVVLFFLLLLMVLGGGAAAVGWYGRASYYVGLSGQQLTIFKGRPGGVLWIHPTVAQGTGVTTSQVESRHLPELQAGVTESSLAAAQAYVTNLTHEYKQAHSQLAPTSPPSSAPSTSVPQG